MKFHFYIFELLLYSINIFFLAKNVYNANVKTKGYFISVTSLITILIISIFIFDYDSFLYLFALSQILPIILLRMFSTKIRFTSILLGYLFIYSINLILYGSQRCIFNTSSYNFTLSNSITNTIVFLICIFCYFNSYILYRLKHLLKVVSKYLKILIIVSCLSNGVFLILLASNPILYENLVWGLVIRYSSVFLSIISLTVLPICIVMSINNSYLKSQNENFQKDIEAQAKHYSDLAKANYELRRFKHDFNNIKIGLEKTLSDNDCVAARMIIENSNYDLENSANKMIEFDTGNGIVDALLSDKQCRANNSNTKIIFSGAIPSNAISPTDLCIIFGNTIDNAIDACEKISNSSSKMIFVSCKCNSGFAFISIANPVIENIDVHGNNLESTKPDKSSHGYGLYSLNKAIKNLDGSLNISCEDKTFKVEIDLCLENSTVYI